jgi:hypothetical protein
VIFRKQLGWRYYDMYFTLLKLSVTRNKGRHSAEEVFEAIRDIIRDNQEFKSRFVTRMAATFIMVTPHTVAEYAKEIEASISTLPHDKTKAALLQTVENMRWTAGVTKPSTEES